jgi:hypothetical protein
MASNPDPARHQGTWPHDEMPVSLPKADPDLPCISGQCRLAPSFAEHGKIAETQRQTDSRTNPNHIIGSFWANPIAAVMPADHRRPRAFPIASTQPPAASSLGGFSTRADTGPAATAAPRPASKNLHLS